MRGHPARRKALREFMRSGYNRWREKEGYGFRWGVESLFSAVKRSFWGICLGLRVFQGKWLRLSSSSGLMHGWSTWLILQSVGLRGLGCELANNVETNINYWKILSVSYHAYEIN